MLNPVGHADTYDVTLAGQGDGDLVVTFRWTTPRHGTPGDLRSVSQPCQKRFFVGRHHLDPRIERVVGRLFEGEEAVLHVMG